MKSSRYGSNLMPSLLKNITSSTISTTGFSPGGHNVTALAANISTIADETKSWCSFAEGAFRISFNAGVP